MASRAGSAPCAWMRVASRGQGRWNLLGMGWLFATKRIAQKKQRAFGQKSKRPLSGLGVREWMKRLHGGDVTLRT